MRERLDSLSPFSRLVSFRENKSVNALVEHKAQSTKRSQKREDDTRRRLPRELFLPFPVLPQPTAAIKSHHEARYSLRPSFHPSFHTSSSRRPFLSRAPSEKDTLAPRRRRYPLGTSHGSAGTERYQSSTPSSWRCYQSGFEKCTCWLIGFRIHYFIASRARSPILSFFHRGIDSIARSIHFLGVHSMHLRLKYTLRAGHASPLGLEWIEWLGGRYNSCVVYFYVKCHHSTKTKMYLSPSRPPIGTPSLPPIPTAAQPSASSESLASRS